VNKEPVLGVDGQLDDQVARLELQIREVAPVVVVGIADGERAVVAGFKLVKDTPRREVLRLAYLALVPVAADALRGAILLHVVV
jgi:hypothetical protein